MLYGSVILLTGVRRANADGTLSDGTSITDTHSQTYDGVLYVNNATVTVANGSVSSTEGLHRRQLRFRWHGAGQPEWLALSRLPWKKAISV